jgi:Tol biopolymer transport system component
VKVNVPESGNPLNFAPDRAAFSKDGTTVAFDSETPLTADDGDVNKFDTFERSGGHTKLVSKLTGSEAGRNVLNGISEDGSRIYFASPDQLAATDINSAQDLYVRVNDTDPVVVSIDPATDKAAGGNSSLLGATEDGAHVYFATEAGIDADDDDSNGDIYDRDTAANPDTTTWLNEPAAGNDNSGSADVMAFSQDAARVFFAATAALTADDTDSTNDLYLRTSSGLKLVTPRGSSSRPRSACLPRIRTRPATSTASPLRTGRCS